MKRIGLMVVAIVGVTVVAFGFTAKARAAGSAKEQISDVEHKLIAATSTDEAMKYMDSSEIEFYDFVPPLRYTGKEAVHGDLDNFFNNATDVKGDFVDMEVVTDGKLGIVNSLQHFTWKDKNGKPMEATLRVTDGFHKVGGQWKLFHSHVSVPVDPKTGMAQMNLKS